MNVNIKLLSFIKDKLSVVNISEDGVNILNKCLEKKQKNVSE